MATELDSLVDTFWNYVQLGQWELSKTTASIIKNISVDHYHDLLSAIVLQPKNHSSGSKSVPTPFHLSWLALQEIREHEKDTTHSEITASSLPHVKELEFHFLLYQLQCKPPDVIKEIIAYYYYLRKSGDSGQITPKHLSSAACDFLSDLVTQDSLIALNLIECLLGRQQKFTLNDFSLMQILTSCASTLIEKLVQSDDELFVSSFSKTLSTLAIIKTQLEWADPILIEQYGKLVKKTLKSTRPHLLKSLWASFVNEENASLSKITHDIEEDFVLNRIDKDVNEMACAEMLCHFLHSQLVNDGEKLFLYCYKNKIHILQYIMEGCIDLIEKNQHQKVEEILSNSLLKPLTPLVLLISWTKCSSFDQAELLLHYLVPSEDEIDGLLSPACKKLIYQTKLIKWCMLKARQILGDKFDDNALLNVLFKQLDHSSVLFVLNETKLLRTLQYKEVIDLLDKQSEIDESYKNSSKKHIGTYACYNVIKKCISLLIGSKFGKIINELNIEVDLTSEVLQEQMSTLKTNIEKIGTPLEKIEVLENIFSLLFLRSSDFKGSDREDIDVDNIEDSSRDSSMSQSLDSNLDDDENVDVVQRGMKKVQRALIFGLSDSEEKKVVSKDDIKEALLQEIQDSSSSDTIQQKEQNETFQRIQDLPPIFLASANLIKEILNLVSDCLVSLSLGRFTAKTATDASTDSALSYRISSLQAYIREAQWRLQLISGFDAFTETEAENPVPTIPRNHVISRMLGSSQSLVFLTLKKGDLIQARQVIKMFNLQDQICSLEMDFIEELRNACQNLKQIRKIKPKKEQPYSSMDFVKSAASAGKLSSEVNQIAEKLLQKSFVTSNDIDMAPLSLAVCLDLMFNQGITIHVSKSLTDLAYLKIDGYHDGIQSNSVILEKARNLKTVLNLILNRDLEVFKLFGEKTPDDFLELALSSSSNLSSELLELEDDYLTKGKNAFKILAGTINVLQSRVRELREPKVDDTPGTSLKETEHNLIAVFTSEALTEFNRVPIVFDYFKSLFRYVKNLAGLQLYYETRSEKESSTSEPVRPLKVANPYILFEEKISTIFGRLLFDWNLSPKKLEMFAKQSGVNLVRVITENCGVVEPVFASSHPPLLVTLSQMETKILNRASGISDGTIEEITKTPNEIVEETLSTVLDMIAEGGEVMPLSASEVCQTLDISTKQLLSLDLKSLKTNVECLTFYINLFNLMFLHAIMVIAADRFDDKFKLKASDLMEILHTSVGRSIFFNMIGYCVGEIAILTAFDVYNLILFDGLPNGFFGLEQEKKYLQFSFESDARAIFLFSFGSKSCPMLQVMNLERLEVIMKSSTMNYLDNHVKVDEENMKVYIPELVILHKSIFTENTSEQNRFDELIKAVSKYAGPVLKTKLQLAVAEKYEVVIEEHDWTFRYPLYSGSLLDQKGSQVSDTYSVVRFSSVPQGIGDYMQDSYPLAGTFIEVFVVKNNIVKETSTVFNNNILCSTSNKKDTPLNIVSSLKSGLAMLTKICSHYTILRNYVVESCSSMINLLEHVSEYEQNLTMETRKSLHKTLEETLHNKFLSTLSPDAWSHVIPSFLACCLESKSCHKLSIEFLNTLNPRLFDLVMVVSVKEIKTLLMTKYRPLVNVNDGLVYQLKQKLLLIKNYRTKSKLTLDVANLMSAGGVFDLLAVCLEMRNELNENLRVEIEKKLKEVEWCNKVYNMCMLSSMNDAFACWQDVENYVGVDPDYVTWFLNDTNAFELMNEWFELYDLPESNQQRCIQSHVLHTLKDPSVNGFKIQSIFARSKSRDMSLKICRNILGMETAYNPNLQLIIHFMLTQLSERLLDSEKKIYLNNKVGIMCVEAIPEEIRESYTQLQHKPIQILEQLLMNLKVKIASKIIDIIHKEIITEGGVLISGLSAQCDDIIARYALLAIKLEAIPNERVEESAPSSPVVSRGTDEPRERKLSTSSFSRDKPLEFIPPTNSVKKEDWVKDEKVSSCMQCHQMFSMFNRRHHCRHCGRVVCAACSNYYCSMTGFQRKERACKPCYHYLENIPLPNDSPRIVRTQSMDRTLDVPSPLPIRPNQEIEWKLSADESLNVSMHEEFRFEQAPNASLCLAIVDLYTNSKAASGLLLKFCNDLSQYLQGPNPEVDVNIVSGMIEFILNHAKLKFMKNADFGGVELCDTHLSRVEILKLLLESNWDEIPTMQEFAQPETLRRLRDKLMEKERFALALEVTSKCGLDATPVHFLMGISRLKCGHLNKAREHLARCLTKTSGDATTSFGPNYHYLQRIIDVIENTPLIALYHSKESSPLSVILQEQLKNSLSKFTLDSKRYNEIVYYLQEYGSHGHMIKFFVRNNLLTEAVSYTREKKCSHEIFITHLLQPSFQNGTFEEVCEKFRVNDPSLKFWYDYLTAACKHLEKHGNFHSLYEVQLFIRDYFRAALTCVRFYLGKTGRPPSSYVDLHRRLGYLQKAAKHLEHSIKERTTRSSFVSHVGSSFLGDDKAGSNQDIPISKLKQHLNTVNLQNDVTLFLFNTRPIDDEIGTTSSTSSIPTLFGNGKERAELVVSLLVHSPEAALSIASRIIQEFKLPSSPIFGRAVVRMANEKQFGRVTSVLQNIEKNGMVNSMEKDDILLKVIKSLATNGTVKDASQFIKQIRGEPSKINAFIVCGRLRDAYLEAVKKERVAEIQRILDAARQASNQKSMVDICEKWLKTYHDKQMRKEQALNNTLH